ncbi:MAG: methyltransferase domain-containing protein [Bacteroidota bacterium]
MKKLFKSLINRYPDLLEKEIIGSCETLLDVGCGSDSPIAQFSKKLRHSVGIDGFQPSIDKSRAKGIHSDYQLGNVLKTGEIFPPKSFDCVVALDLVEHLEKADGLKLIADMEKIARKKVIIFTPTGFQEQRAYDGNEYQIHRSGWEVEEMQKMGYRVLGINGWKPLRGERAEMNFKPKKLWYLISLLTQPFTENSAKQAYQMLCIKDL